MLSFIRQQAIAPTKKAASFSTGDVSSSPIDRFSKRRTRTPSLVAHSMWAWGIAGMLLTGTNQYNRRKKPVPVSKLYPPQIPRGLSWDRNRMSSVRRRLSVSAVARAESPVEYSAKFGSFASQ
jgi:hypothetical protein